MQQFALLLNGCVATTPQPIPQTFAPDPTAAPNSGAPWSLGRRGAAN